MMRKIDNYLWPVLMIIGAVVCYVCGAEATLREGGAWWERFAYEMCHANVWHLAANVFFLVMLMYSGLKNMWLSYLLAYLIAASAPALGVPTMGMSGVCYALMGMCSWQVRNKWRYHAWSAALIGMCLLWPGVVNNVLHVWSYVLGVGAGWAVGWILSRFEPKRLLMIRRRASAHRTEPAKNGFRPKSHSKYTKPKNRNRKKNR